MLCCYWRGRRWEVSECEKQEERENRRTHWFPLKITRIILIKLKMTRQESERERKRGKRRRGRKRERKSLKERNWDHMPRSHSSWLQMKHLHQQKPPSLLCISISWPTSLQSKLFTRPTAVYFHVPRILVWTVKRRMDKSRDRTCIQEILFQTQ